MTRTNVRQRNINRALLRTLAVFSIAALLSPILSIPSAAKSIGGRSEANNPIINNAPPEPFVIVGTPKPSLQVSLITGLISVIAPLFGAAGKSGGPKEESVLEFEGESFATAPEPVQPPVPTGTVEFDFDGDGKADVGQWHATNHEFSIQAMERRISQFTGRQTEPGMSQSTTRHTYLRARTHRHGAIMATSRHLAITTATAPQISQSGGQRHGFGISLARTTEHS